VEQAKAKRIKEIQIEHAEKVHKAKKEHEKKAEEEVWTETPRICQMRLYLKRVLMR
jgi:hypothetical protein